MQLPLSANCVNWFGITEHGRQDRKHSSVFVFLKRMKVLWDYARDEWLTPTEISGNDAQVIC